MGHFAQIAIGSNDGLFHNPWSYLPTVIIAVVIWVYNELKGELLAKIEEGNSFINLRSDSWIIKNYQETHGVDELVIRFKKLNKAIPILVPVWGFIIVCLEFFVQR